MEDKILIKSEVDKQIKNFLQKGAIIPFVIAVVCATILSIMKVKYTRYYYVDFLGAGRYSTYTYSGWERVFTFDGSKDFRCFLIFLVGAISLLIAITIVVLYFINHKCELCITENNIKGKTLFGKEVVLPLYMISSYSTRKLFSVVTIATASGITNFSLIGNYKEIGEVLATKINERQKNTETVTKQSSENSKMDDLVKLKSLLDSGIITQEEFDTKKKQFLDL